MEEKCESSVKCNSEVEKAVMDTPERSNNKQIATTVGEFEDSPVFAFLNSLSPIKPVKSTHMTQAINPLSFVSPPSIFSSAHVDSSGESRVLRRHQFPDPSQPEFSSYDGNTVDSKSKDIDATKKLDDQQENLDPWNSHDEAMGPTFNESTKVVGALGNNWGKNSAPYSSVFRQYDRHTSSNNPQLVPTKAINESPQCIIPSTGLHLNALGTTPEDYNIVNHEALASGRLLIGPSSSLNFHPPTAQELLNNTLSVTSAENIKEFVLPGEDACQPYGYVATEEINSCSPKKKRHRSEQGGGNGACMRCNCKKSKCLKLYCECFAAGVYCVEPCACIDCFNKPVHVGTVLATRRQIESRNPLAFAPKLIGASDPITGTEDDSSNTPASARHKRGCNCKKSGCLKKYCECYQGGVGCSVNCRCEECKNAFGRKDGMEAEYEVETDATETSMLEKDYQETALHNEQNMDSAPLATPLLTGRLPVKHLFSDKRPPRCSFPSISAPSSFYEPRFFQPQPKFDRHLETVDEDEIPKSLREGSPISGVKSTSPNNKRVSPPYNAGTSSGLRSSRKLILRSIPSLPSFAPN
ncbi:protein tesmin/TSO1-like CXC 2 isoform X2 [Primulina tabacum]|uniref:protein tesmin/TSO1-like CXC 2 isoform X2 n=1 Tax=Primulina tabacum TaxID=48773 RepID=UPI003F59FC26